MKQIYLSSVALEKNRWAKLPERVPSFNVSDLLSKIKADGFIKTVCCFYINLSTSSSFNLLDATYV